MGTSKDETQPTPREIDEELFGDYEIARWIPGGGGFQ
jgi:hypothetical protein